MSAIPIFYPPSLRDFPHLYTPAGAQLKPTEEKKSAYETKPVYFNAKAICHDIAVKRKFANDIILSDPDLLASLSHYRLEEILAIIKPYASIYQEHKQIWIDKTLKILYSTALRSLHHKTITDLEKNIGNLLKLSEKRHFAEVIQRAKATLSIKPKETLADLQHQIGSETKLFGEIEELISLFWYSDPENKMRIENVYTYSKSIFGKFEFPECRRLFPRLYQSLAISKNEMLELKELRKGLIEKTNDLRKRASPLFASVPGIHLDESRQKFHDIFSADFWQAGKRALEKALLNTFREKSGSLPERLSTAILKALQNPGFAQITFANLSCNAIKQLPEQFVSEVWTHFVEKDFLIQDTDDFMRYFLSRLSDPEFQKLKTLFKDKNSEDRQEVAYAAVVERLKDPNATFMTLIDWVKI